MLHILAHAFLHVSVYNFVVLYSGDYGQQSFREVHGNYVAVSVIFEDLLTERTYTKKNEKPTCVSRALVWHILVHNIHYIHSRVYIIIYYIATIKRIIFTTSVPW